MLTRTGEADELMARDKQHLSLLTPLDTLVKISRHALAPWLLGNASVANLGLKLRIRIMDVEGLGDDSETRLAADPGLTRLGALCSARQELQNALRGIQNKPEAAEGNPSVLAMHEACRALDMSPVFAIELDNRMHEDMLHIHGTQILSRLSETTTSIHTYTKGAGDVGTETSWKHGLDNDASLEQILAQGKDKQTFKGNQLRADVEKLTKVLGFV